MNAYGVGGAGTGRREGRGNDMKKTALLLVLALLVMLVTPSAQAASNKCGDNITWSYNSNTKTLTITGSGRMYDYAYGKNPWYSKRASIEKVVVTGDITYIGGHAFHNMHGTYSLPDTVLRIGEYAFSYNDMTSLHMPSRLEEIGRCAFQGVCYLESITIPSRVHTIESDAFQHCFVPVITLNAELKTIGREAFYNASYVTELNLPEGLENIGDCAFAYCARLTEITIPGSVTTFNYNAFARCPALQAIYVGEGSTILSSRDGVLFDKDGTMLMQYPAGRAAESYTVPSSVTQIRGNAFQKCANLQSATIPGSVSALPANAFLDSAALTEANLLSGVASIGDDAFKNTGLAHITLPDSLTAFGTGIFDNCPEGLTARLTAGTAAYAYALENSINIEYITPLDGADMTPPAGLTTIEESAFEGVAARTVRLPEGVTSIGSRAFADCPNLRHIYIPGSVTKISGDAFDGISELYLYGSRGSAANDYAKDHPDATFIRTDP